MASDAQLMDVSMGRVEITRLTAAAVTRGEVAHLDGSGAVINADADADENIGIFLEDGDSGTYVRICVQGQCLAVAYDSSIVAGDWLIANANGRLDTIAAVSGGTQFPVAHALSGADAAGQLIPVVVNPHVISKDTGG